MGTAQKLEGTGIVVGKKAPDFLLGDHPGGEVHLSEATLVPPVLPAFYPGDFTTACTGQRCDYRDSMEEFNQFGIQIFGVSHNSREMHKKFADRYQFAFLLRSDHVRWDYAGDFYHQ